VIYCYLPVGLSINLLLNFDSKRRGREDLRGDEP